MDASQPEGQQVGIDDLAIETGVRFLRALFAESDIVLFRPIEAWTEDGKKRSRVLYKSVIYQTATLHFLAIALRRLSQVATTEHANIFFGACPRVGDGGQFDQAWQIRTVRALWCDIDHVTVDEARERVVKAGLPEPSIVVNSGNGVHLYWLLTEPLVIDEVEPPPVFIEWVDGKKGKKRPRRFLKQAGSDERLYLDIRANVPELPAKAIYVQDVIAGIGSLIGGDHTHDLSRILRVPGTFNRKDERNNRAPVLCDLISCNEALKYPLADFAKFADKSPAKCHREQVAAVRLPTPKTLTPTRRDKLSALVNACAVAPVSTRSHADWHLVCTAIEKGWPKAEVWEAVATVGKFAERGEEYFERTWTKAEAQTREQHYQRAVDAPRQGRNEVRRPRNGSHGRDNDGEPDSEEADPGIVATLAQLICEKEIFAQDDGGKLYRYQTGVYQPRGEALVRTRVKKLCKRLGRLFEWSSHIANEVVEFIRVDSPMLWQRPPGDVLNVKNGLLNIATRELGAHSPSHLSAVQLPVTYDPTATCPKIDKFVSEVFPEDATTVAYEIPSWLMIPDTSIQKAVLLIGPGGNGKSRYLRMVEAFIGKLNIANLSLHRLESDKFACARLYGKLANICPDLPTEHLAGTSIFKAITGGDPVTGEYKFKDSFDFTPFARLVFSANNPPRAMDASEGFFDRWLVVPFDQRFRGVGGEIPADKLDAMLSEPSEQSGLLNRALAVLTRLQGAGRFSNCASVERAFSEFHAATDPLSVWLDGQTIEGPRLLTTKRAMISAFNDHCERNGRSPTSEKAFGSALKRLRPEVTDAQRTVSGKVQWCYVGIGLKSDSHTLEDDADSPASAKPRQSSRDSRDSRDSPLINLSHSREKECPEDVNCSLVEQDMVNRVNRVNRVNEPGPSEAACEHVWQDVSTGDGRARRTCAKCQKFYGYVDLDADQRRLRA